jgi:hypothetical protein
LAPIRIPIPNDVPLNTIARLYVAAACLPQAGFIPPFFFSAHSPLIIFSFSQPISF